MVGVRFFVFDDFQEITLEFVEGNVLVGIKIVAHEDVDACFVYESFPRGPAMDVADDVIGGHGCFLERKGNDKNDDPQGDNGRFIPAKAYAKPIVSGQPPRQLSTMAPAL